jgi:cytoskeletal protein CcmA (bactofilin family)
MSQDSFKAREFNVIGEKSEFTGKMNSNFETYLYGSFNGELNILNNDLNLERNALLVGKINAQNVYVWGKIEGDIIASGKVVLYPTANLVGSIKAATLVVHPGAQISATNEIDSTNSLSN